ncbi:hypothetical protein DFP81_1277 [Marinomonas pollencensis]|uniref:Uncharacterized protein n=1 Tax=Marinomonas pollencensis TaxID=491954 RepID=A0A3E0D9I9_9GAMM|nr:hypothetical protein DFP81_1277 [Marinomonas pollencensis]
MSQKEFSLLDESTMTFLLFYLYFLDAELRGKNIF